MVDGRWSQSWLSPEITLCCAQENDHEQNKRYLCVACFLAAVGLVFLTGTAAAAAILRIELRSSRYFRFESRRRSAASEKVWIVERPLIVLESVRDRILPLCRPACVIELRQLIRSHVPFIERL